MIAKTGRNDPCPCGSGRKYKKCCLGVPGQVLSFSFRKAIVRFHASSAASLLYRGGICFVVKRMLSVLVQIQFKINGGLLQLCFVPRNTLINPFIKTRIVEKQGCLDSGDILGAGCLPYTAADNTSGALTASWFAIAPPQQNPTTPLFPSIWYASLNIGRQQHNS